MDYELSSAGQIYQSWAIRIGKLQNQYKELSATLECDKKYEATLSISLFGSLLNLTKEIPKDKALKIQNFFKKKLCSQHFNIEHPTEIDPTGLNILNCFRNAIAHPVSNTHSLLPITGFTSISDEQRITDFVFTHSPCVSKSGNILTNQTSIDKIKNQFNIRHGLTCTSNEILLNERLFVPWIRITISTTKLSEIINDLSTQLAS